MAELQGRVNQMIEWSLRSTHPYSNPFREAEVDLLVTDPEGRERRVPAFWCGADEWRVRYLPLAEGIHRFRSVCSEPGDQGLHGREGQVVARAEESGNPLFRHGPLRVSESRRYLEHRDGTPFFWLGDTWWLGLSTRLRWPGEFRLLLDDRLRKGFSVVQIVMGLSPDLPIHDSRASNEAGYVWTEDLSAVNPAFFDMADLRIDALARAGIVPCIVGCWGYYLDFLGEENLRLHWRYLVARYGAYPVVWCLAGEALMPYYLKQLKGEADRQRFLQQTREAWTRLTRYVRDIDPYGHPVTIHPSGGSGSRQQVDQAVLDFDMLQTGHGDRDSLPGTLRQVRESYAAEPRMPVLNGEVCYEGIGEGCREGIQRLCFWGCVLSGACGHTYGACGLFQMNRPEELFGSSPHGDFSLMWGDTPWEEAYRFPGSAQVGLGRKLLERYEWWRFEPRPEWMEPHATVEQPRLPYAAGIPGKVRVIYVPTCWSPPTVKGLEPGSSYRAYLFDPRNGREREVGEAQPDARGDWRYPRPFLPAFQDWVLVLERR